MKGADMSLLDRIANYFKEWDGIDETAPKMELNIHELRYIADMNVERCRLIRQLNEANLKTEKLLVDKTQEIRAKAIYEFAERLKAESYSGYATLEDYCEDTLESVAVEDICRIAEEMRGAE